MSDDTLEALGQVMLAQYRLELERQPAEPLPDPKPPERYKPGTRRESHIKHTKQRWAAH